MIFCFDLDNTLCSSPNLNYSEAVPLKSRIQAVQSLHREGHKIIISTARGSKSGLNFEALTRRQLDLWGLDFATLHMGKPAADFYVDDKAISDKSFFGSENDIN